MCESLNNLVTSVSALGTAVGVIVSFILQLWPGWDDWVYKRHTVLLICMLVPIIALLAGTVWMTCEGMALTLAALATALVTGGEAFIASQGAYKLVVKKYIARN